MREHPTKTLYKRPIEWSDPEKRTDDKIRNREDSL